jgi:hypothetical protein
MGDPNNPSVRFPEPINPRYVRVLSTNLVDG